MLTKVVHIYIMIKVNNLRWGWGKYVRIAHRNLKKAFLMYIQQEANHYHNSIAIFSSSSSHTYSSTLWLFVLYNVVARKHSCLLFIISTWTVVGFFLLWIHCYITVIFRIGLKAQDFCIVCLNFLALIPE